MKASSNQKTGGLSRRDFMKQLGTGVVVLVGLGPTEMFAADLPKVVYPEDFNAYLLIGRDGRVTVYSGKIEMGQGVLTSQAQMAADELGVPLSFIDMVLGDTEKCPWDIGTFGSLTTRMFGPALRAAAAKARLTLFDLASEKLGVPADQLAVKDGVIFMNANPARKISYGELTQGRQIARVVDRKAVLKAASEFSVMGTSPKRLDALDKVTGGAKFTGDIRLPGLLYARILRPPVHGATLASVDVEEAKRLSGVTLIRHGDLVAVLHADPETAATALARVKAEWNLPEAMLNPESIFEHLVAQASVPKIVAEHGAVKPERSHGLRLFESTFRKGYVAHAPIEPHSALADVKGGSATVWASTQTPFPTRERLAAALGLEPKRVRVITPFVGGGFGGKSADEQALEAARLSQLSGKPVLVAWTREEEFFHDHFDPAAVVKITSGLTPEGRIGFWDSIVYAAGERGAVPCYDIADLRVKTAGNVSYGSLPGRTPMSGAMPAAPPNLHPFAVGPWRAPGANLNIFAIESQVDMMAAASGRDPLSFRFANLADTRMRRVLQAAADAFRWTAMPSPSKRGVGIACSIDAGTYVAAMAEVQVDEEGNVTVRRIVCAQDMGIVVNPAGAIMQMEGAITMGLGYALSEELNFLGGEILDRNFDSYQIPRFSQVPKIEAVLVKNDEVAPQGGGEPPITITGAVIANAIFDATGVRLNRMPMTPERIKQAIRGLAG
jgi:nicotinate dehydrogenase subunit B